MLSAQYRTRFGLVLTKTQDDIGFNMDDFKTQPPVDHRYHSVPAGFYSSKQLL